MLLKSQRKALRHVGELIQVKYVEIEMVCSKEQCIENVAKREGGVLPREVVEESFRKYETSEHAYLMKIEFGGSVKWEDIVERARVVQIEHPEMAEKQEAPPENAAKDSEEVKIRKFVSQLITDPGLREAYLPEVEEKKIPGFLSGLKKQYRSK